MLVVGFNLVTSCRRLGGVGLNGYDCCDDLCCYCFDLGLLCILWVVFLLAC